MDDEALIVRARALAGEISAAEANLAAVLAEVERRELHSQWECRSIERFAGWHLRYAPGRAKALAEVGRAMETLPVVAEAVADGTLSFDKARSIVRVAAPDTEGALVELALHATTAQTQRICGKWGKVDERDRQDPETDQPVEARPTVIAVTDDDGVELRVRFDHVHGQLVLAAIDGEAKAIRNERADAAANDPDETSRQPRWQATPPTSPTASTPSSPGADKPSPGPTPPAAAPPPTSTDEGQVSATGTPGIQLQGGGSSEGGDAPAESSWTSWGRACAIDRRRPHVVVRASPVDLGAANGDQLRGPEARNRPLSETMTTIPSGPESR